MPMDMTKLAQKFPDTVDEVADFLLPVRTTAEFASVTNTINTVDKRAGKIAWNATLSEPVFATGALAADSWDAISAAFAGPPTATTAELAAIGDAINTTNKRPGKIVWNSTTSILVVAVSAAAGGVWNGVHDNLLDHTPI